MSEQVEPELKAPLKLSIEWCPKCGRDDRVQPLNAKHYSGGKICRGTPIEITYTRVPVVSTAPGVDDEDILWERQSTVSSIAYEFMKLFGVTTKDGWTHDEMQPMFDAAREIITRTFPVLADLYTAASSAPKEEEAAARNIDYFDPISLMEKAMRTTMEIGCDCPRKSGACDGECIGSRIWQLIHRARKLIRAAKPAHASTTPPAPLVSDCEGESD